MDARIDSNMEDTIRGINELSEAETGNSAGVVYMTFK